jgi:hypothetical protein
MKNLGLIGDFLLLSAAGPGRLSLGAEHEARTGHVGGRFDRCRAPRPDLDGDNCIRLCQARTLPKILTLSGPR